MLICKTIAWTTKIAIEVNSVNANAYANHLN